jgi:hypothetical protein
MIDSPPTLYQDFIDINQNLIISKKNRKKFKKVILNSGANLLYNYGIFKKIKH